MTPPNCSSSQGKVPPSSRLIEYSTKYNCSLEFRMEQFYPKSPIHAMCWNLLHLHTIFQDLVKYYSSISSA